MGHTDRLEALSNVTGWKLTSRDRDTDRLEALSHLLEALSRAADDVAVRVDVFAQDCQLFGGRGRGRA